MVMEIPERGVSISSWEKIEPGITARAEGILSALDGFEIDTAVALLEWCSRTLLEQRVVIRPGVFREFLE